MKNAIIALYSPIISICLTYTPSIAQFNQSRPNQTPINYNLFNRPTLGEINIQPPQPFQFTPFTTNTFSTITQPAMPNNVNSILGNNSIEEQNKRILQQNGMLPGQVNVTTPQQVVQLAEIERELMQEKFYREQIEWRNKTEVYRQAFDRLMQMNVDSFSLTDATFLVENAFLDGKLSYEKYLDAINFKVKQVKQILRREQLDTANNLALNYGIQKLFTQSNYYYDFGKKQLTYIPQYKYDFEDFRGEKDYDVPRKKDR